MYARAPTVHRVAFNSPIGYWHPPSPGLPTFLWVFVRRSEDRLKMAHHLPDVPAMDSENRLRILIIDDDQTDREIYRQSLNLLEGKGFEFAEADSGTVGIRTACEWSPVCVLLDYSLPDMDGLEVLARLRNSVDQHPFPIVMLTA